MMDRNEELKVSIETITPQMAREYLKCNIINRKPSFDRIKAYSETMESGHWQLNGDSIKFGTNGELKDGQHRLLAIIKANTPIETVVMRECDATVFDRGRNRSVTDELLCRGVSKDVANHKITAVAQLHFQIQESYKQVPDDKINEFIIDNYELIKFISAKTNSGSTDNKKYLNNAPLRLAILYAMTCGVKEQTITRFCRVLGTGFYDDPSEVSAIVARNDINRKVINTNASKERICAEKQFEKSIYDFDHGIERKKSYGIVENYTYANSFEVKQRFMKNNGKGMDDETY